MLSFTFPEPPDPTAARGRKYIVTTEGLGTAVIMGGHWLYEPSVILPSPLTGNKFVLLLNRNKVSGQGQGSGEVITARTSISGSSHPWDDFGPETTILDNSDGSVDNICDMIDARPIWDGSQWHIYVQALPGIWSNPSSCPGETTIANVYEAVGPSLNPPSPFQWVKEPGTDHARAIISGGGLPVGIGEALQWYNPSPYGLSGYPFMVTYNDWSHPTDPHDVFNKISQDDNNYVEQYHEDTPYFEPPGFGGVLIFPDAILLASLDAARLGNPGIGFSSQCWNADHRYTYCKGIGFFNNPSNVPATSPKTGWAFYGEMEGIEEDEGIGPRMMVPRVARNEYGYIPPKSYHGYPRAWETYLYYNYQQINSNENTPCNDYDFWNGPFQLLGCSRLTITEKSAQH